MNSLAEKFSKTASLNNIAVYKLEEKKNEFRRLGYNFEDYFLNENTSVVKALAANAKEANAVLDASDKEKLSYIVETGKLIVIIDKNTIFDSMQEAYKKADSLKSSDYMIFVSQESKTADIEKQLVSGVQGAETLEFVIA